MSGRVPRRARGLWTLYEPIHAVTYFAPEAASAFAAAGLRGFWRGYFAGRSAPLGTTGPAPVVAIYAGFAPGMVARALPSVWELCSPAGALAARAAGSAAALRTVFAHEPDAELLALLESLVAGLPFTGRPLGAANAAVDLPDDPVARLWQLCGTLREWRGDAHVAGLVGHGLSGLDALALRGSLDIDPDWLRQARGWSPQEWAAAVASLTDRGLVADGSVTEAGRSVLAAVEQTTDAASVVGDDASMLELARMLTPFAGPALALLPVPNPIGLAASWDPVADPDAEAVPRPA